MDAAQITCHADGEAEPVVIGRLSGTLIDRTGSGTDTLTFDEECDKVSGLSLACTAWQLTTRNTAKYPQQRLISPTPHLPPKGGILACELKRNTGSCRRPPLGGLKIGGIASLS